MKKVIMQVSIAGMDFSYYPGEEAILDDELAEVWNEVGHCKIISDVIPTPEPTPEPTPDETTKKKRGTTNAN